MKKYGFIGNGVIGRMLIERFLAEGLVTRENLYVSNSNQDNPNVIVNSDIIYLCVRPQNLGEVFSHLAFALDGKILVTTVAAIELRKYYEKLGNVEIIRIIPSITNKVGGTILFSPGKFVQEKNYKMIFAELSRIAQVHGVSEREINNYTHLASCSPAIFAYFIREYLLSVYVKDKDKAKRILFDSIKHTLSLIEKEGFEIIDQVCTKQGISKEGVDYMEQNFLIKDLSRSLLNKMEKIRLSSL